MFASAISSRWIAADMWPYGGHLRGERSMTSQNWRHATWIAHLRWALKFRDVSLWGHRSLAPQVLLLALRRGTDLRLQQPDLPHLIALTERFDISFFTHSEIVDPATSRSLKFSISSNIQWNKYQQPLYGFCVDQRPSAQRLASISKQPTP